MATSIEGLKGESDDGVEMRAQQWLLLARMEGAAMARGHVFLGAGWGGEQLQGNAMLAGFLRSLQSILG